MTGEEKELKTKYVWRKPLKVGDGTEKPIVPKKHLDILNPFFAVVYSAPAGMGKTSSLINYGRENDMDVFLQECSTDMIKEDFIGQWTLEGNDTVFLAGEVSSAFHWANEHPDRTVLLIFDEINLIQPAVLKGIGSVFDDRKYINVPDGRIIVGDNLIISGTMNSEENSAGYLLDVSFRSRVIMVNISIPEMIGAYHNVGIKLIKVITNMMEKTKGKFSLREVGQMGYFTASKEDGGKGLSSSEAFQYVIQKYDYEDRKQLEEIWNMSQVTGEGDEEVD